MKNTLYYGDNLEVLREHIPDESVDLVYLDPPFNSDQNYNVGGSLFLVCQVARLLPGCDARFKKSGIRGYMRWI